MSGAESRRTAIRANVGKLLLLAALTPPVIGGIAERASLLGDADAAAGIVAATISTGAVCAVIGALCFGWAADHGPDPVGRRWLWVLLAVLIGTAGLAIAMVPALPALVGGWATAQFGYSGAMALLRTVLATAGAAHRRRGSVVMVLGGYLGIFIPVLLLIALPQAAWVIGGAFALIGLAYTAVVVARARWDRGAIAGLRGGVPAALPPESEPLGEHRGRSSSAARPIGIGAWRLLLVQCLTSIVVAAFVSYHPLDLEQRLDLGGAATVRASALVVAAALGGLIAAALALFARPERLRKSRALLIGAALLLACSIGLRAGSGSLPPVVLGALLSGAAVGVANSVLLASALEIAPAGRAGRFIGAFSAAGAFGQVAGPVVGLALMNAAPRDFAPLELLMLCLTVAPLGWAILLLVPSRTGADHSAGGERAEPR
ncbi:MFS transporter [Leucobacter ruminantium]|uniref:MFS transporter n=1 Tax=Leucobacter ruminantium TaxID=1289170 RepID=A0A939LX29_9MICO|nr:MFS transporter [Leucobacter ruminantium]